MKITHERGMRSPASEVRAMNSTYIHIKTGKVYIQTAFPTGSEWKEELIGDAEDIAQGKIPAAASTLVETLVAGNVTGGTDITLTSGDKVLGSVQNGSGFYSQLSLESSVARLSTDDGSFPNYISGVEAYSSGYSYLYSNQFYNYVECADTYVGIYTGDPNGVEQFQGGSLFLFFEDGVENQFIAEGYGGGVISLADSRYAHIESATPASSLNLVSSATFAAPIEVSFNLDKRAVGLSAISSGADFEKHFSEAAPLTYPHYSSILASKQGRIRGRDTWATSTIGHLVATSNLGGIRGGEFCTVISSGVDNAGFGFNDRVLISSSLFGVSVATDNTTIDDVTRGVTIGADNVTMADVTNVVALGIDTVTVNTTTTRDNSLVTNNAYIKGALNLPVLAADPGAPVDGDTWIKDTGGVRTINSRIAGVTYSVILT